MEASGQTPEQPDSRVGELEAELESLREQLAAKEADIHVPSLGHAPETPEDVQQLAKMFAEYRGEVAALREDIRKLRGPRPLAEATPETLEERTAKRLAAIAEHSHYCPACGNLGKYPQRCTGIEPGTHAPQEMVETDELSGDPNLHTAAPSTDPSYADAVA